MMREREGERERVCVCDKRRWRDDNRETCKDQPERNI